jgi:twinkle protein
MGSKYPAVSIHGAASAERDLKNDFEYLNSFETIVLAFDNDEAGKKAVRAATNVGFPLGKLKVLTLRRHKDANDYLLSKEGETFVREWWQAPEHKPDGLKLGSEMWDEIINRKESFTTLYPFDGLNGKTFGIRLSELVIVTADTGVGKTSLLKHIEHKLLTDKEIIEKNYGVGFLHLEEPNGDTALGLLSVHNSTPYHLPTTERNPEELRKAYDEVLNNGRVVIWDHFGSNSVDAVLNKVRHMAALGCKYIVLDHLSIVVSDQSGDERKQLDEIATKLKTLTMELDLAVIAVIHTNRQGQIRGTAGVEQLSNIVIRLERNKTEHSEWRRNVTRVSVEKNRFCGYTGPASYLWYNKDTARLVELTDEEAAVFEAGGQLGDDEIPF